MTHEDYARRPAMEERRLPPAPFDRAPTLADEAAILRHWHNGKSAYEIGTLLRLRYAVVEGVIERAQDG